MYIKEAHPSDGIVISGDTKLGSGWSLAQPKEHAERLAAAREWRGALGAHSPYFVDGIGNEGMAAFCAWPERLFVVADSAEGPILELVGGFGPERYDVGAVEAFLQERFGAGGDDTSVRALVADVQRVER